MERYRLVELTFWFLLSPKCFAKFSSLKSPASHHTEPLNGLPLSLDCPSHGLPLTKELDLSMDCPSHWTEPVKCSLHTEPSTDWTSHWTAPLNGLDLSWTGPLTGLDLAMDCSCSGLPDFLVEFFLKNLGLLDLLSRSKRSLLPMINTSYWLDNCIETEDRVTIAWHIYMVLAVNCDKSSTLVWW